VKQGKTTIVLCGETIVSDRQLTQALQRFFEIKFINDAADLIELPPERGEQLILWELPGIGKNQLEQLRRIRQHHPGIKIIVIEGGASTRVAAEILKAGASDIFPKPFDHELLIDRVVALLS